MTTTKRVYRDSVGQEILLNDIITYTAINQGNGLKYGKVVGYTPKRIKIIHLNSGKPSTISLNHCLVVTLQLKSFTSMPVMGRDVKTIKPTSGQSARSYFKARGLL
jgi:hypothetical protein